jgi:hypothetical protein
MRDRFGQAKWPLLKGCRSDIEQDVLRRLLIVHLEIELRSRVLPVVDNRVIVARGMSTGGLAAFGVKKFVLNSTKIYQADETGRRRDDHRKLTNPESE